MSRVQARPGSSIMRVDECRMAPCPRTWTPRWTRRRATRTTAATAKAQRRLWRRTCTCRSACLSSSPVRALAPASLCPAWWWHVACSCVPVLHILCSFRCHILHGCNTAGTAWLARCTLQPELKVCTTCSPVAAVPPAALTLALSWRAVLALGRIEFLHPGFHSERCLTCSPNPNPSPVMARSTGAGAHRVPAPGLPLRALPVAARLRGRAPGCDARLRRPRGAAPLRGGRRGGRHGAALQVMAGRSFSCIAKVKREACVPVGCLRRRGRHTCCVHAMPVACSQGVCALRQACLRLPGVAACMPGSET
jgi:hypothetical protein